jgi:hypothetical protein
MRAKEITQKPKAHHSILMTLPCGAWKAQLDSHAYVTIPYRGIPLEKFVNIINHMCAYPDVLPTIPIGRGAYFQDTNSKISVYVTRISTDTIRIETVLDPSMRPKPPLFRRPVPAWQPTGKRLDPAVAKSLQAQTQAQGRDAASQQAELMKPLIPVNRAERRALSRAVRGDRNK